MVRLKAVDAGRTKIRAVVMKRKKQSGRLRVDEPTILKSTVKIAKSKVLGLEWFGRCLATTGPRTVHSQRKYTRDFYLDFRFTLES